MPDVTVTGSVASASADAVFVAVADFGAFPRLTDTVRAVVITAVGEGVIESAWEVDVGDGVLCWTQRDIVDVVGRRITFEQVDGDFAGLEGAWSVDPTDAGARATFSASVDPGGPGSAPATAPAALRALAESMRAVLVALFGPSVTFS